VRANVILAVAVAAAAAAGCDGAAQAKKSDAKDVLPVDVVTVQRIELRRSVEAVGTLAAHDQATVSAEVAGRVARMAVDMGDKVKAGSPLVLLDAERLRYHANEQQAALQQRLGAATTRQVTLTTKVDPSLIGGVVARIGATVYDGSLATQLAKLKGRLAENR